MGSQMDYTLDQLADELQRLKRETDKLTQSFRNEEILSMESGEPNEMASEDEVTARKKFARMREVEALLNIHHGT